MTGRDWLLVVLALAVVIAVGVPLLGDILRRRDFRAQVSGKKPERRADDGFDAAPPEQPDAPTEADGMKWVAEMKSKQNIMKL